MLARVNKDGSDCLFDLSLHCLLRCIDLSENLESLLCAIVISRRVCITEKIVIIILKYETNHSKSILLGNANYKICMCFGTGAANAAPDYKN